MNGRALQYLAAGSANFYHQGSIDEFRFSNTARSADWVTTEYNNQNSPSTFLSVGSEVSSGAPPSVATPAFSPAAGSYASAQTVTISPTTTSIRYTTDGSTPSSTVGTVYGGAITVSVTTTLKAIAYASGMTNSAVASARYTITWYNTSWTSRKSITVDHTRSLVPPI